jgi:hypothetical protein
VTELHSLVRAFIAPPATLGMPGQFSFDQSTLRAELARLRRGREIAFWICFSALLAVFVLSVVFLVQHSNSPAAIQKMSAATGLTIIGVVGIMTKLWQDKVKADLVLAMVSGMSEESLKDSLRQLVDKL